MPIHTLEKLSANLTSKEVNLHSRLNIDPKSESKKVLNILIHLYPLFKNNSNSKHEQIQGVKEITHALDGHINLARNLARKHRKYVRYVHTDG